MNNLYPQREIGIIAATVINDADLPSASLGRLRLARVDTSNHVCVCVYMKGFIRC
jgi:hypothetical protein